MFGTLTKAFSSIFSSLSGKRVLTEDLLKDAVQQVREALLQADVPYAVVEDFVAEVHRDALGKAMVASVDAGQLFMKIVHDQLVTFLGGAGVGGFSPTLPSVVMVMGLQGSGKTTTLAKLAVYIKAEAEKRKKTRTILMASVDFYRPAALDQLEQLSAQVGASFMRATATQPVDAAREIYAAYKKGGYDLLFLDTAGRLHIDSALLQELREIDAIIEPKTKLLVLDAMTGQESLAVARAFDQAVGFTGALISKMDSDARGGVAFAFRYALKKPIIGIGVGEKPADFELFYPERIAQRMLDLGDVVTLVERAQAAVINPSLGGKERFTQGKMTLQDFADQLTMLNSLGSLGKIASMLPGMGAHKVSDDALQQGEVELKKFKAIISSMTVKERIVPSILDRSRKLRIAKGAGVQVDDITVLLQRFEQIQQLGKLLKGSGRSSRFPRLF
jgi:signal recognition particle subunit SRP54